MYKVQQEQFYKKFVNNNFGVISTDDYFKKVEQIFDDETKLLQAVTDNKSTFDKMSKVLTSVLIIAHYSAFLKLDARNSLNRML